MLNGSPTEAGRVCVYSQIYKPCVGGSDNREQEGSLNLPNSDLGLKWFDLPCLFHVVFKHFCMLGFNESLVLSLFAIQTSRLTLMCGLSPPVIVASTSQTFVSSRLCF
ncbi:hypothetical protein MC885_013461, partial [Smutsia gigantea]